RRFAERYRGRIGSLGAEELAGALDELARIRSTLVRLTGAARLRLALNVNGAAERAAGARADAIAAGAEELLRFFELEWLALPDSRAEQLVPHRRSPACATCFARSGGSPPTSSRRRRRGRLPPARQGRARRGWPST